MSGPTVTAMLVAERPPGPWMVRVVEPIFLPTTWTARLFSGMTSAISASPIIRLV
ncbi:hypothetical protein D3C87_953350 [compost metagenome]